MSALELRRLRRLNLFVAITDLIQAVVILAFSTNLKLPVTASYLTMAGSSSSVMPTPKVLFNLPVVWLVVAFFVVSAISHLLILTTYRQRYEAEMEKGINRIRWLSYGLAGGSMIVAIGLLSGLYDVANLAMMFGLTALLCAMGLVTEIYNASRKAISWLPYLVGVSAGIIPWLVLAFYLRFNAQNDGNAPAYVYLMFVSLFIVFTAFAFNMLLHYRKFDKWRSYVFTEKTYIWLGVLAKSALAWQIFIGVLHK